MKTYTYTTSSDAVGQVHPFFLMVFLHESVTDDVDPGTLNIVRKGLKEVMVLSQISAIQFDLHWT